MSQLNIFKSAVIYTRISTLKEEQLTSLVNQEHELKQWAHANQFQVEGVYQDTCSGGSMECREGLLQAISHANEIGATILITELHRLSRSVRDIAGLLDAKVKFIITQSGQQISKPMILMMAVLAETTRDQISQSVSRGIQAKFDREPEARANWGRANDRQAVADLTRGRINKADRFALENGDFAFLMRKEGLSYRQIAEIYTAKPNYTTSRGNQNWNGSQIQSLVLRYERLINETKEV